MEIAQYRRKRGELVDDMVDRPRGRPEIIGRPVDARIGRPEDRPHAANRGQVAAPCRQEGGARGPAGAQPGRPAKQPRRLEDQGGDAGQRQVERERRRDAQHPPRPGPMKMAPVVVGQRMPGEPVVRHRQAVGFGGGKPVGPEDHCVAELFGGRGADFGRHLGRPAANQHEPQEQRRDERIEQERLAQPVRVISQPGGPARAARQRPADGRRQKEDQPRRRPVEPRAAQMTGEPDDHRQGGGPGDPGKDAAGIGRRRRAGQRQPQRQAEQLEADQKIECPEKIQRARPECEFVEHGTETSGYKLLAVVSRRSSS
ncbi:MAG: hypothetical protein BWZ08_02591 [candidate division BRC1 bacterium ADurb.BinA292]|nr:MAG: hypothetical protein BWZ08_02591 [candidate division BRC1 bacterium ADurb.BinA292]